MKSDQKKILPKESQTSTELAELRKTNCLNRFDLLSTGIHSILSFKDELQKQISTLSEDQLIMQIQKFNAFCLIELNQRNKKLSRQISRFFDQFMNQDPETETAKLLINRLLFLLEKQIEKKSGTNFSDDKIVSNYNIYLRELMEKYKTEITGLLKIMNKNFEEFYNENRQLTLDEICKNLKEKREGVENYEENMKNAVNGLSINI